MRRQPGQQSETVRAGYVALCTVVTVVRGPLCLPMTPFTEHLNRSQGNPCASGYGCLDGHLVQIRRVKYDMIVLPKPLNSGPEQESFDPSQTAIAIPRKVLKGGSLCRRYRPAARHAEPVDTSASHVGFRCIIRRKAP